MVRSTGVAGGCGESVIAKLIRCDGRNNCSTAVLWDGNRGHSTAPPWIGGSTPQCPLSAVMRLRIVPPAASDPERLTKEGEMRANRMSMFGLGAVIVGLIFVSGLGATPSSGFIGSTIAAGRFAEF